MDLQPYHFDLSEKEFLILKEPGSLIFSIHVLKASQAGDIIIAPFHGKPLRFDLKDGIGYGPESVAEHTIFPEPVGMNEIEETKKADYLEKLHSAIVHLHAGNLKKVVLSRTKVLSNSPSPKPAEG